MVRFINSLTEALNRNGGRLPRAIILLADFDIIQAIGKKYFSRGGVNTALECLVGWLVKWV